MGITPKHTRPPSATDQRQDRTLPRTLADGWAYARFYPSETLRRAALPSRLHFYNHHRPHSSTGGKPPLTRLINLPGHHSQSRQERSAVR
ncbi:integrase core domain-containing protein [Amycolatopsis thermoflava]|uniref:integrase core domain-containing protein n=1 Tax=Amycolatopsis thermoflava TaxID=84480 RepID=UPI00365AA8CC